MATKEERKQIFLETERYIRDNRVLSEAVKHSKEEQKYYCQKELTETDIAQIQKDRFEREAEILVSKERTFQAASKYIGMKTAVLNFASARKPGGGVKNGASAQEECLCRCSTLYPCLNTSEAWERFYSPHQKANDPLHNDDIIYTPEVIVFKTDTERPHLMAEADWYKTDVITCAAPNLGNRHISKPVADKMLFDLHTKRIERILDVGIIQDREVMILGAFGCGAFANRPEIVAEAFRTVIKKYKYAFKVIEFAVFCTADNTFNYQVFTNKFRKR